jgi:hypothetical protein
LDEEVQRATEQTQQAEARNEVGVYVYALPHYIRHPYDHATGRTLLKVGRSDRDVIMRFRNQTRTTALPEEPILLRIYRTNGDSAAPAETVFHRLLDAADHSRTIGKSAGREWFLTHTRFLDEIARTLSLRIDLINEGEFDDNWPDAYRRAEHLSPPASPLASCPKRAWEVSRNRGRCRPYLPNPVPAEYLPATPGFCFYQVCAELRSMRGLRPPNERMPCLADSPIALSQWT